MNIKFSMTNDSVTVYLPQGPRSFYAGSVQYASIRKALLDEGTADADIMALVEPLGALTKQLYGTDFLVSAEGGVTYKGNQVPDSIVERMNELVRDGQSVTPIARFFERLDKNPSWRSRTQLFDFIKHLDIKIEDDGTLLAYKAVSANGFDKHSGTIDNTPGQGPDGRTIIKMERNLISDDPSHTCHFGLHVGARGYVYGSDFSSGGFAERCMIVRVCPSNVVCVPNDYSGQKMRVCEYEVVGEYTGDVLKTDDVKDVEFSRTWGNNNCEPKDGDLDDESYNRYEDAENFDGDDDLDEDLDTSCGDPQCSDPSCLPEPSSVQPVAEIPSQVFTTQKKRAKHRFDKLRTATHLMELSIEDLRKYAGKSLKIVGASKLGGGKSTLVAKIMDIRAKLGR